jgi:phosphatidylinositol alpha-1,6-mannosyltransferase
MIDSLLVATLNYPPKRGGIEQMVCELVDQFVDLGVEVHVVAPATDGAAEFDVRARYRITRFGYDRYRHVRLHALVARLIREGNNRVLFGQWPAAGPVAIFRRLLGQSLTLASIAHGKEFLIPKRGARATPLSKLYCHKTLRNLDAVFAMSRYTGRLASDTGARFVQLIPPGVDFNRFQPNADRKMPSRVAIEGKGPFLLTVARLVPRKGIDTVIESLPRLTEAHPGLSYLIAGDGEDRERLEELSNTLGVRSHVQFLGRCSDDEVTALYAACDVFLLQSRIERDTGDVEGLGLVLLEAQASGTPVIAARSGGMPDALVEGETGLLVPPGDRDALAVAIGSLLGNRERLVRMGQAARRFACTHSWRETAVAVLAAYESPSRTDRLGR